MGNSHWSKVVIRRELIERGGSSKLGTYFHWRQTNFSRRI
jgi:hypothetical protein